MRRIHWRAMAAMLAAIGGAGAASAQDAATPAPPLAPTPAPDPAPVVNQDALSGYLAAWSQRAAAARATQPAWSSPLVTTTGLLEQRVRFDISQQHAGNGASTLVLDGGKGLDLIVGDATEIQIAAAPYDIRDTQGRKGWVEGFGDWPFLRIEERLASAPSGAGDYVVTAFVTIQAPTGIAPLTSDAWTYTPTLAFGKGFGRFDIQATVAGVLPASHTATLGRQIATNVAFQYHVGEVFWPQLEVNWTHWVGGSRGGLDQVYLTPGLVLGRFALNDNLKATVGFGYQSAIAPSYRAKPLTPSYNSAWLFTSRLNF